MTEIVSPFQQFFDTSGAPLANGQIFIGTAGLDAQSNPTPVYWDDAFTIPAPQPIRTLNGYPAWNGAPAKMFVNASDFSITVRDARNVLIFSSLSEFSVNTGNSIANVLDYGATGTGIADDTAAFIAAAATGKNVYAPTGTYLLSAGITLATNGQRLFGDGENKTVLVPSGNFDVITLAEATDECGIDRMSFNAASMTGGYIVNTNGADRVSCQNLRINSPWNGFRVFQCNVGNFQDIWCREPRGPYFIYAFGESSGDRSDIITLINVTAGGTNRTWTGIYADGTVQTIRGFGVGFINPLRGLHVVDSGASPFAPAFFILHDFEVDFPQEEGIRADAGVNFMLTSPYIQGSRANAGMYFGSAVRSVQIANGFITGNNREGIVTGADDVSITNAEITFNGNDNFYAYDAMRIEGASQAVKVSNCQFGGRQGVGTVCRYGVSVENGARNIRISNSSFYGCALGDVLDNSGGTSPLNNVEVTGSGASERELNERVAGFVLGVASGSGATVSPTILGGVITGITSLVGGTNYEVAPSVLAFDPAGTGAGFVGTATISGGAVTGITIANGGTNYSANTILVLRSNATPIPTIQANWPSQTNTNIRLKANGSATAFLANSRGVGFAAIAADVDSVNYLTSRGRASGTNPDIIASGSDANIDIGIIPKGTGRLRFGGPTAGTAGAILGYLEIQVGATVYKLPLYGV